MGVLFSAEHAYCAAAVEGDVAQSGERPVPVGATVADLVVLLHPDVHAGRFTRHLGKAQATEASNAKRDAMSAVGAGRAHCQTGEGRFP